MRVSIIGGGIMGLCVARALLKKGIQVQVFEQFAIPNPRGSSCDHHRLIRYPYGAHKGYMLMVREAYAAWDAVWKDIQTIHYAETGTLVTSRTGGGWASDSLGALTDAGISLSRLHPDQLTEYIPLLPLKGVQLAYYLESGGVLFAEHILISLKEYLLAQGVAVYEHTKIHHIDHKENRLITADGTVHTSDNIVVTAGPWAKDLFPTLPVTPSQQTVYYLDVPEADIPNWRESPMILDIDLDSGFYLVPPVGGLGLKIGDHRFTLTGHPDSPQNAEPRTPNAEQFPYPISYSKTCFYTVAPNEEFIYQHIDRTHVLAGFSGHGFKFGPVIGDRFAEVVCGGLDASMYATWLAGK